MFFIYLRILQTTIQYIAQSTTTVLIPRCKVTTYLTTAAKVNWKSVTPHQKNALNKIIEERLLKIHIPNCITECRNVSCRNKDHVEAIDLHVCTFLGCIITIVLKIVYHKLVEGIRNRFQDETMK